ncbi:succinate dehydrogenase assembly factor 1, mitochondrial-like [Glandiceps talaboti]
MVRHSKLQKEVLSLYRHFLRVAAEKPGAKVYVQQEFRKHAQLPRTDTLRIEFMLRRGRRQLEMLQTGTIDQIGSFQRDEKERKE